MEKRDAALEELHARCDALDTCLQAVMGFIMWKNPEAAAHLKDYLRAQAAQAGKDGVHHAHTELPVRFAEWAASTGRVSADTAT